jgi:hypothetical protein
MSLQPFIAWCNDTTIGTVVRDSVWLFPVVEAFHLLGLCALAGTVLVVDLRLWGVVLPDYAEADLAEEVVPWMLGGLAVTLVSGVVLFLAEPQKCYENPAFWVKMASLALALAFTFTVRWRVTLGGESRGTARSRRTVAAISMLLWSGVGMAGRGIAFW